jgi:hypothetical protein
MKKDSPSLSARSYSRVIASPMGLPGPKVILFILPKV